MSQKEHSKITERLRKVGESKMIREYIIKISDEIMEEEIADRPQELVRCKDCKYRREIPVMGNIVCVDNSVHSPDWFCADGERKEGR